MADDMIPHAMTPDGERTANWAMHEPGFFGSVRQLTECARCGDRGGRDSRIFGAFTPATRLICRPCYDALPE